MLRPDLGDSGGGGTDETKEQDRGINADLAVTGNVSVHAIFLDQT